MPHLIGRPEASEISPIAQSYVALVPGDDPIQTLVAQASLTHQLFQTIGDARASLFRYAEDKWTAKEVLNHLTDTERILTYRALRLARADSTPLPGFEQNDYVPASQANRRPLDDLLAEAGHVRAATVALFRSFPPEAWTRTALVSGRPLTVRALAFTAAGHELHHVRILTENYLP